MKKIYSSIALFLSLCIFVFSFCACSSKSTSEKEKTTNITNLSFSTLKSPLELGAGDTREGWFGVTTTGDYDISEIDFYSSNPDVAKFEYDKTVLDKSVYYVISGVSSGEAVIYAQTKDGSVKTEEVKVTVKQEISNLKFATLTSPLDLKVGKTRTGYFSVDAVGSFSIDDIEFYTSDANVATFEYDKTTLETCIYYTITGVSAGECVIYAKAKSGEAKTDEIKVVVS